MTTEPTIEPATERKHAWALDSGDYCIDGRLSVDTFGRDPLLMALYRVFNKPRFDIDWNVIRRWRRDILAHRSVPELEALI